jgi:hypothetical protein
LTWNDLDRSRAADALPGDDFTSMAFIIQQFFTVPRLRGAALAGKKIVPLYKEFLRMKAVRP